MPAPAISPPFPRIAIVGLGLIGGSIALAARSRWPDVRVIGVDRPEVLETAWRMNAIDETRPALDALGDADLVVLASPVGAIVDSIAELAGTPLQGLVTDVGSTKREIMAAAARARLRAFVGGHPMAGGEAGGIANARADLFESRPWILVDAGLVDRDDLHRLERFARELGAVPTHTDADTHDRVMAYVSHLPQLLALALMSTAGEGCGEAGLAQSGRAFAEMTRLASSPPDIWRGILATNADFIAEAVAALRSRLQHMQASLSDGAAVEAIFHEARQWRERLPVPGGDRRQQ